MKPSATYTMHATQRMHERGITQAHTQIVLKYGEINCDSYVLNQKNTQKTIHDLQKNCRKAAPSQRASLQHDLKILKQILDKGGVVVVEYNNAVLTCYNFNSHKRRKNYHR